jgi:endonuclease G
LRAQRFRELVAGRSFFGAEEMRQALEGLEEMLPYNCEHVVPQSWFGKREPMRGDLHHLFACESGCNSFRGNTPYFDFPDFREIDLQEVDRNDCGRRMPLRFEPWSGKGAVARATLYFLTRYPGEINRTSTEYEKDRVAVLLAWHHTHPVTDWERHRNAAIHRAQGNRNPLIDHPEWARSIDFGDGLG